MLESVVECLVKRFMTPKDFAGRCAIIFLDVVLLVACFILAIALPGLVLVDFVILAVGVLLTALVFRNTNIEYEYTFFDGELSIDKVMAKRTRKHLSTFMMGKMEYMAPLGSSHVRISRNEHKVCDYSTRHPEDVPFVAVLYDDKEKMVELRFSPNEELIERLSKTYPRKVYMD